jgi:RNase P/RNase MRP subunit p29
LTSYSFFVKPRRPAPHHLIGTKVQVLAIQVSRNVGINSDEKTVPGATSQRVYLFY